MAEDLTQTYDRATFLFENKEFAKAAELFARLVEEEPDHLESRMWLARSYYHSAQLGRAEEVLVVVVGRWPSEAYAHLLLARTLQRAGRAEEGRQHLLLAEAMGLTQ
ncbi:tetratricopeptide repeat protein [Ornithinimicrobium faecis]|uniref:CDC27 family protein n=1 Tax=Ornithinimicrobium faecis TaxID=2934158 RepID=A0ABY4YTJ5_9MICO|nr:MULTISPECIES: tetratricopeptide repeat protein [unclassified Ornithinimicrobium]USQ79482.1 CDC27 family protein [Ornithinimicrobium sp. HY1793]